MSAFRDAGVAGVALRVAHADRAGHLCRVRRPRAPIPREDRGRRSHRDQHHRPRVHAAAGTPSPPSDPPSRDARARRAQLASADAGNRPLDQQISIEGKRLDINELRISASHFRRSPWASEEPGCCVLRLSLHAGPGALNVSIERRSRGVADLPSLMTSTVVLTQSQSVADHSSLVSRG